MADVVEKLREIVGSANVLQGFDASGYLSEPRHKFTGAALCVVRPRSTAEVSSVLKVCHAAQISVVPQGGNTGLVGGQIPDGSGTVVVLSLSRMKAIREIDSVSNVMVVEAGLTLAREQQPDLVLMDIQLPGMDGLQATALLKQHEATRAIPVIALTALAMKGDEERIRAAGCDGYIAKPMRYQEFLATVAAHLTPL